MSDNAEQEFKKEVSDMIDDSYEKSHSEFEKSLTYISSGVLVGSLFFIEKIIPLCNANAKIFLLLTWIFSGTTLLISLISHYLSSVYHSKISREFSDLEEVTDEARDNLVSKIDANNDVISGLNLTSLISLIIGVIQLVLFVSLNLFSI